ncbi:ABC transporter permease protein [Treponema primitia ZAS-2]|uniref:ABC transporter permease protein n=1 Tax=Treponema primitia (strain ATCC BAA-887 / DSM 12427 / ZAS-2) TaxID=545694 RepID=F5YPI7_TREPZ|nr:iron ABC transporter permease [Treponema primitia]AEF86900.1 ABC transporter permease protein [Treponema primitia ZAS-2]
MKYSAGTLARGFRDPWILFALFCILISIGLIILPQLSIFLSSFRNDQGMFSIAHYKTFFTGYRYQTALLNSIKVTLCTTLFATLIAVPLAWLTARFKFRFRNALITLITMATASPPFLGAYAWIILLGRYGAVNRAILWITGIEMKTSFHGGNAVIWVITWMIFPLIFLMSLDSFSDEDIFHKEAAMSLGANRLKSFFHIELPLAMPGILTGMLMAGLAAFADFGTPIIIGGEFPLLPTTVYNEFVSEVGSNMGVASTTGIIMIIISTIALYTQRVVLAQKTYSAVSVKHYQLAAPNRRTCIILVVYILIILIMSFLPHITLGVVSFMKWKYGVLMNQFTLENYQKLFRLQRTPILMTFALGLGSTALTFIFGIGIAYIIVRKRYPFISSFINTIIMIPYVIPGTVLAVGFIMIFNKKPLLLTGTWVILMLSYFIRKLPYSVKSSEASLYSVHRALEEAAMASGARPFRAFKDITLPLMMGGVISGATLSFLQIMTELSSTIILYRPPYVTMPVVIFENAMSSGADFGIAASMGILLLLFVYIPLLLVNKFFRLRIETA